MGNDRLRIERAIEELDALLEGQGANEEDFQTWFQQHPVVFEAYGYKRILPKPVIQTATGAHIPDFLVQRLDGYGKFSN